MEGSKLMGILDDVTHSGDQPEITLPAVAEESIVTSFTLPEEDVVLLKDWLNSATDEQKEVIVGENVTKVIYSHPKIGARSVFVGIRGKIVELSGMDGMPRISKYHTLSYSNATPFTYTNDLFSETELEASCIKLYVVLDGTFKTTSIPSRTLAKNEIGYLLSGGTTEELSNSGEVDSLILCLTLV